MAQRISAEDWGKIVDQARADALAGDRFARNFIANYLMGRPVERIKEETDWTPEQIAAALDGIAEPEDGGEGDEGEGETG